jgi:hypothetical protein
MYGEDDPKGSPFFIILFKVVIGVIVVVCIAAIFAGGYAN